MSSSADLLLSRATAVAQTLPLFAIPLLVCRPEEEPVVFNFTMTIAVSSFFVHHLFVQEHTTRHEKSDDDMSQNSFLLVRFLKFLTRRLILFSAAIGVQALLVHLYRSGVISFEQEMWFRQAARTRVKMNEYMGRNRAVGGAAVAAGGAGHVGGTPAVGGDRAPPITEGMLDDLTLQRTEEIEEERKHGTFFNKNEASKATDHSPPAAGAQRDRPTVKVRHKGTKEKHAATEDSAGPVIYHLATDAEEKAHTGTPSHDYSREALTIIMVVQGIVAEGFEGADFGYEPGLSGQVITTLRSFLGNTVPITAVSEVIVAVLDGADLPASSLTREAIFKSGPIHEKVTSHEDLPVIHVLTGLPTVGAARNAGVKQSNGEILFFFEPLAWASHNFLIPQIRNVNIEYNRITHASLVPVDAGKKGSSKPERPENCKKTLANWGLDAAWIEDQTDDVAILGNSFFTMTKKWFLELGPFDEHVKSAYMTNLDYSFRGWLCGGDIYVARDSRVSVPRVVLTKETPAPLAERVHLVEKWFDKDGKERFYEYYSGESNIKELQTVAQRAVAKERAALYGGGEGSTAGGAAGAPGEEGSSSAAGTPEESSASAQDGTARKCKPFHYYMELFADDFLGSKMLATKHYQFAQYGGKCLTTDVVEGQNVYTTRQCKRNDAAQQFFWFFGNGLRNVGNALCLDGAFAKSSGHKPISFSCMKVNRNQEWQYINQRLMWGSFCLTSPPVETDVPIPLTLDHCYGQGETQFQTQIWKVVPMD